MDKICVMEWATDKAVAYQRLLSRWKCTKTSRTDRKASHSRLTPLQTQALLRYIDIRDKMCLPLPLKMVRHVADAIILRELPEEQRWGFKPVSESWGKRWVIEHGVGITKAKPIEQARKEAHQPDEIRRWFDSYNAICEQYSIKRCNKWNFDETGFRIGIGGSEWIVTFDTKRRAWHATDSNRTHITAVESVSADGRVIEPMFLAAGKVLQERWFMELHDDVLVATNDSGYLDDERALLYIQHFERLTRPQDSSEYRLLVCDNYGSHCFREFIEYANNHRIILFGLRPHTSHFTQPLDVVVFQPYKHYHRQAVIQASREGCEQFTVTEFMAAIGSIRTQTFTSKTIQSGWRKTGLDPVNVERSLNFLRHEYNVEDISALDKVATQSSWQFEAIEELKYQILLNKRWNDDPPSSPPLARALPLDPALRRTPPSIRTLARQSKYLDQRLANELLSSPSRDVLRSHLKGSVVLTQIGAQAQHDLSQTETAQRARNRRDKATNRSLQTGGALYAAQARSMVKQLDQTDAQKAIDVITKEKQKQRKRWKTYKRLQRQRLCVAIRGRGAVRVAALRSTPHGRDLYYPYYQGDRDSMKIDKEGVLYTAVDRSRHWQSYYPKDDPACSRPLLVATKKMNSRKLDRPGSPTRQAERVVPSWIKAMEPTFQLAIRGYTERESIEGVNNAELVRRLVYDFARNHVDDRELSDEEERLHDATATTTTSMATVATACESSLYTQGLNTQTLTQDNRNTQDL